MPVAKRHARANKKLPLRVAVSARKPQGKTRHLYTMADVVTVLGGRPAVAILTKRKPQHLNNWFKVEKKFPASTYLVMTTALAVAGCTAAPALWGITAPE